MAPAATGQPMKKENPIQESQDSLERATN